MKAIVVADECIGCGLCESVCPDVFEMQEDKAVVKGDSVPEAAVESCKEAAESCPVDAIKIEE